MKAFRIANVWGASGVTIVNNSFKSELFYTGPSAYGIELHSSPNAVVQNNLFLDIGRNTYPYITIDNSPGATVSNNAVYMTNGQPPAGFPMPNDAWQVDPKLTDVSSNDFRPTSSSPLIDAGMTLPAVSNDYSGVARPQGHYDIGAYQFPRP